MFAGISTLLFGDTSFSRFKDENARLVETDIRESDGDEWVLIDIESEKRYEEEHSFSERVPREENRNSVPELTTKNTRTATHQHSIHTHTNAPLSNNNNGTMEGSWFVTPPPCFTHPNTFTMESSPLEDILIEHPSISVFSPRPPPAELKPVSAPEVTKEPSQRCQSSSAGKVKVTKSCERPTESENSRQRRTVYEPSVRAGLFTEITNVLAPMQKAKKVASEKYLKKSFMNRQNKVAQQLNPRPPRRHKLTVTINGYSINRKMC